MKRIGIISLVILMFALALAACGGNNDNNQAEENQPSESVSPSPTEEVSKETVKVSFLNGIIESVDWYNEVITQFNEQNPGIVVEQEFQKEAANLLKIKFASGDAPDLNGAGTPQEFIDQGYFEDFTDHPLWDRTLPGVQDIAADKNGKNYHIPLNTINAGIFYNKAVFEELGLQQADTWEQFVANLETVKAQKADMVPLYLGGKDAWTLGHLLHYFPFASIQQELGVSEALTAMRANDQATLNIDREGGPFEVFAANLLELESSGLINGDAVTATYDNQMEAIANGKAAFVIQGMWALNDILKKNPDIQSNLGFAPFPAIVDSYKPALLASPDGGFSVNANSENKEATLKFVEFLLTPENLKSYSKLRNAPSIFADAQTDWSVLSEDVGAMGDGVFRIMFSHEPVGYNVDAMGKTVQELLVGAYKKPGDFAKAVKKSYEDGFTSQ